MTLNDQEIAVQGRGSGTESIMILDGEASTGSNIKSISYVPGSQVARGRRF